MLLLASFKKNIAHLSRNLFDDSDSIIIFVCQSTQTESKPEPFEYFELLVTIHG